MEKYLITSPDFYTDKASTFREILDKQIKIHKPRYVLYRDKNNLDYDIQAATFVDLCLEFENTKSFIHQKVNLAKKLQATGVHLTSLQFDEIQNAKRNNLEVIISTHTHAEVLKAQELGADAVTYSPIFTSPNKGEPKGVKDLEKLLSKCSIKVFALGGIVEETQIKLIHNTGVYGFASIRYFT